VRPRIAIIGAGISGLTLAEQLKEHAELVLYEKARGVGGRMSTRYAEPFYFDHGTQFFTARTPEFQAFLEPFLARGIVAEWRGDIVQLHAGKAPTMRTWNAPHYVASPSMNALCKTMAEDCNVRLSTEVAPLKERRTNGWVISDKGGQTLGEYDWVISTAPPAQTAALFATALPADAAIHLVRMQGCYALMLGVQARWAQPWIAAEIENSPIQWVAVNSTKPGRNADVTCIVAHSRHDWADAHMDDDMAQAQAFLLPHVEAITGLRGDTAEYLSTHRWKYALMDAPAPSGPYLDTEQQLAATGDWCAASRIEDVWIQAVRLANTLAKHAAP
jgi:renalase